MSQLIPGTPQLNDEKGCTPLHTSCTHIKENGYDTRHKNR
jgi:hypothetical protein